MSASPAFSETETVESCRLTVAVSSSVIVTVVDAFAGSTVTRGWPAALDKVTVKVSSASRTVSSVTSKATPELDTPAGITTVFFASLS